MAKKKGTYKRPKGLGLKSKTPKAPKNIPTETSDISVTQFTKGSESAFDDVEGEYSLPEALKKQAESLKKRKFKVRDKK